MDNKAYTKILINCPVCNTSDSLRIPSKIINESNQLTTVSIPKGLVCKHNFQAYVDKNFHVRGYQKIDFECSKVEIYKKRLQKEKNGDIHNLSSTEMFEDIIRLLRSCIDDNEVIGSALLTVSRRVLYSSLPHSTLLKTIKEFEVRDKEQLILIRKMVLELENKQKVFSVFTKIKEEFNVILVLIFAPKVRLGMGNLLLRQILKKINTL